MKKFRDTKKRQLLAIILCLFLIATSFSSFALSQSTPLALQENKDDVGLSCKDSSFVPEDTAIKLLASDKSGLIIENTVASGDLNMESVQIGEKCYQKLVLPGYVSTMEVGKPQIPIKSQMVYVPESVDESVDFHLEILSSTYITLSGISLYPVPEMVERTSPEGYVTYDEVFAIDNVCYATDTFYPGPLVEINGFSHIRDQPVVRLFFQPLQYNPVTCELRVYTSIQVKIQYSSPADLVIQNVGPLESICSDLIVNYESPQTPSPGFQRGTQQGSVSYPSDLSDPGNSADYLIITSDCFYDNAKDDIANLDLPPPTISINSPSEGETIGKVALVRGEAHDKEKITYVDISIYWSSNSTLLSQVRIFFGDNHGNVTWEYLAEFPEIYYQQYYFIAKACNGTIYSEETQCYVNVLAIGGPPVANAQPKYQEVAVDHIAFFNGSKSYDPDNDTLTYRWDINGEILFGETIEYQFTEIGFYEVVLNVSDGTFWDTDTCTVYVNYTVPPVNHPPFANASPVIQAGYVGDSLWFDGSVSYDPDNDDLVFFWDFGDGNTSSDVTASHQFNSAGNYFVTLTVYDDGMLTDMDTCFVIIGPFCNTLNKLAHWRAEYNGFDVAVVNVNDPFIGGNNDSNIRTFISDVYHNWSAPHMTDGHVGYILLVGDTPFVATHLVGYAVDRWYVCIGDQDYHTPDIMIGRFSVDDQAEVEVIAEKPVPYEQTYSDTEDWHQKVMMVEGWGLQFGSDWYPMEKEILLGYGGWNVSEVVYDEGGTSADIIENITNGIGILACLSHGEAIGWGGLLYSYQIPLLVNGDKLPLVYSMSCLTGSFQNSDDCFGEIFVNTPDKGAVAFLGSSATTGNIFYSNFLFPSLFEHFEYILGRIIMEAIMQEPGGVTGHEYNLLGDPALDLSGSKGYSESGKPDLALSHLNITIDPAFPQPEDEVNITATILNIGGGAAENVGVRFILVDYYNTQYVIGDETVSSVSPGGSCMVHHLWDTSGYYGCGKYSLIVQIDPENTINESYELNNQAGISILPLVTYVNSTYDEATPGFGETHFKRIQDGINGVANTGTVFVSQGTYQEHVTITKPVHLFGEGRVSTFIDGGDSGTAVGIAFKNDVVITGFTIRNSSYGVRLDSVQGTTISENIISDNNYYGIYLVSSNSNTISGNTISNNGYVGIQLSSSNSNTISGNTISNNGYFGIQLSSSNSNTISGNTITYNEYYGIYLDLSNSNTISGNTISNNSGSGICLYYDSSTNTISGNTINDNTGYGIYLSYYSSSNTIIENDICRNTGKGIFIYLSSTNNISKNTIANNIYGIHLEYYSSTNSISKNILSNNTLYGLYLAGCTDNTIFNNTFINNTQNAYDAGSNTWYNATLQEGNYWDDYTIQHPDPQDIQPPYGVWDDPYNVSGKTPPNQDIFPQIFLPDLLITLFTATPISETLLNLTVTIKNNGTIDITTPFQVAFYSGFEICNRTIETPGLNAHETIQVTIPWTYVHGITGLYAVVDSTHVIEESNELNNWAYVILTEPPLPDLIITDASLKYLNDQVTTSLLSDQVSHRLVQVTASIKNDGAADITTPFQVSFYGYRGLYDSHARPIHLGTVEISSLSAGETTEATLLWRLQSEIQTVLVFADSSRVIKEADESNNEMSIKLPSYPLWNSLTETQKVYKKLNEQYKVPSAEKIIALAEEAVSLEVYVNPQEYLDAMKGIAGLGFQVGDELKGQVPDELLQKYQDAVKQLIVLTDSFTHEVSWEDAERVAEIQLQICELVDLMIR
ncbi:MAG: C25 family cysteine peptidase [Euryarchaeota archaeon]|nr:C25 family cysteine peptidase [Euryarchaeota archaeon]